MTSAVLGIMLASVLSTAATPPEGEGPPVVSLRVPSARVQDWLPPGTELKGMAADAFDRLLRSARSEVARRARIASPRILKASHSARWRDGLLVGRSRFVIEAPAAGSGRVVLSPWTAAVVEVAGQTVAVRSEDDGRTMLRVSRGTNDDAVVANVDWQLRSRPGSDGKKFALGLPASDASMLTLDLPDGWEPDGPSGLRTGPAPSSERGRAGWTFVGRPVSGELLLIGPDAGGSVHTSPLVVAGTTRVDVGEAAALWKLVWNVTGGRRTTRPLVLDVDAGLTVLSVTGPGVADFRSERTAEGATRLTVQLAGENAGTPAPASATTTTTVIVTAKADVPSEGRWIVPSARPVNAVWTGGRTTVRADASRVIADVRVFGGRRVAPPRGEAAEERRLDFEAERPGPVAELDWRRPEIDAAAEVAGRLLLGGDSPRLTCRIAYRIDRGRPTGLAVDLPRSWFAERVAIEGLAEPPVWHPEVRADGSVRLHVSPPSGELPGGTIVLNVAAASAVAGGRGPLALPRVRPIGVRVADELWVARVEPGMTLLPIRARGLAWIDALAVKSVAPWPGQGDDGLPAALAWRWTEDDGEAAVERGWAETVPSATVEVVATVGPGRMSIRARVVIVSHHEPLRSVLLGVNEPVADPTLWRVTDEATGLALSRSPAESPARSAPAVGRGPWWRFDLPRPQNGRVTLEARYEGPWDGNGRVPLPLLPAAFRPRGRVLILASRDVRAAVVSSGANTLDPRIVADSLTIDSASSTLGPPPWASLDVRRIHALEYSGPEATLDLQSEVLATGAAAGVIREAVLTEDVTPRGGEVSSRLTLKIVPDRANELLLVLPQGSQLDQMRRGGQPITPTVSGSTLSIPLGGAASNAARPPVVITLDYRRARVEGTDRTQARPLRPWFSMPCLSLSWELIVPERWTLADWGPALVPTDPALARPGLLERLSGGTVPGEWGIARWLTPGRLGATGSSPADSLRELDRRVAADPIKEIGLGAWLTRLDSGNTPIIIDASALAEAGWGPRSRVSPALVEPARPLSAVETFRLLGLSAAPIGSAVLISTPDDLPSFPSHDPTAARSRRLAWESSIGDAVVWGSDPSGRFQSVARWRDPPALRKPERGRTSLRFVAVGWPESGVAVRLIDRRGQEFWGWTVGLGVLTLGLWARRRVSSRVRAALATALAALGLIAAAVVPPWFAGAARGASAGACALAFFWVGGVLPAIPRRIGRGPRTTSRFRRRPSRSRAGLTKPAVVVLVVAGVAATGTVAAVQKETAITTQGPILVLFPYDGPPDPGRVPNRVLLRLSDYERLRALADGPSASAPPSIAALAATHRVLWRDDASVLIDSDLTLVADGRGQGRWTFPVGAARSIAATLDGVEVPVLVAAGGATASVAIDLGAPGPGREQTVRLRLRRRVLPRRSGVGDSIRIPINPVAAARVEVGAHPAGLAALVPNTRGRIEDRGDIGPAGWLGPVDRLEVRWPSPAGERAAEVAGTVDGLYLWDALTAGDRVRARLTYHHAEGTPVVRVMLDPGAIVRDYQIAGSVDVSLEGTRERPEWVARVDPPLPDGATVALDLWRPLAAAETRKGVDGASPAWRRMPRVEPLHAERSTAALAFRRPADWTGRIAPEPGAEALGEEWFARSWGSLPVEPLTLSGAVRVATWLGRNAPPTVETGPGSSRSTVTPSLSLTITSGRVEVALDAELTEAGDPVDAVTIAVADGLRLDRVSADGLTSWARPEPGLLRLRFDGPAARSRNVRVRGWIAVASDPLAPAPPSREIDVPWPRWPGQQEQPGTLTVISPTRFQSVGPTATTALRPVEGTASTATSAAGAVVRGTYRVSPAQSPGRLRWEIEPPRVAVFVRSQLTLNPDSAEWLADLRYEVSGGPLEEINLRLPAAWARHASVWLEGVAHQQAAESRGESTFWSIRPDRPIWGTQRVVMRSTVPFPLGSSRAFPELKPRGRGEADTTLRLVNATRRPVTHDAKGVRAVATLVLPPDDLFTLATPRGADVATYHVDLGDWSFRILRPGSPADAEAVPVARAELECDLAADGSVFGSARYHVGAPGGRLLPVQFATGSTPLWATVNGASVRPLNARAGRWLIPLPEEPSATIDLVWHADPTPAQPISMPQVGSGRVPLVLTIRAPDGTRVDAVPGRLAPATPERLDLEIAGWLMAEATETLDTIDRGSRRDVEDLVAAVIRFELRLRQAERSSRLDQVRIAANRLRDRLAIAARAKGLDDSLDAARVHLGLSPMHSTTTIEAPRDASPTVALGAVGRPFAFIAESMGSGLGPPALVWGRQPRHEGDDDRVVWAALAVLTLAGPPIAWAAARGARSSRRFAVVAMLTGLALAGFWGGPSWLFACLGLALTGRITRS